MIAAPETVGGRRKEDLQRGALCPEENAAGRGEKKKKKISSQSDPGPFRGMIHQRKQASAE